MEHLRGQSSRVRLPMGSRIRVRVSSGVADLGAGICAPCSCSFWALANLLQGYLDKSVHEFVHDADLVYVLLDCRFSSWSRATRAEALEVGMKS